MPIVPQYPPRYTSGIYSITHLATGRIYVGSSINIARRWQVHISDLRGKYHRNAHLQRAWDKYGEDAFQFAILELVPVNQLLEREQYWMDHLCVTDETKGFNLGKIARAGMRGRKHTPETRRKLSEMFKGRKKSPAERDRLASLQKGVKQSAEQRAQKSASQTGRKMPPRTDEWKRHQSEVTRGRKLSPEHSEKIREGLRKKHAKPGSHLAREYIVTTPEGEDIPIYNLSVFCRDHGLSVRSMSKIAHGITHTHKGWKCRHKP